MISVYGPGGALRGGGIVNTVAACLEESGADEVFMNNLDEIASRCLRWAAVGVYPPRVIRGRLSGVYFRPRFLADPLWPPGNILKEFGFRKLTGRKCFDKIFFMDEYLLETAQHRYPGQNFFFLPDPWDGTFLMDQGEARQKLGIPPDRFVFLCFGIGDRRKGLHLAVRALMEPPRRPSFAPVVRGQSCPRSGDLPWSENIERTGPGDRFGPLRLRFRAEPVLLCQ